MKNRSAAERTTLLIVLAILVLVASLFVSLVTLFGLQGVALFLGLVVLVALVAALTGASLEVVFAAVAYAVGFARSAVARAGKRLGK